MSLTLWPHAKALFDEAQEYAPEERAAFLDAACTEDGEPNAELRREVERLLAYDDGADAYFDTLGFALRGSGLGGDDPMPFPDTVGPWQVRREIGRGGMGQVLEAVRADGLYEQRVALKLVRPGLGAELVARFRSERRMLATLEHPGIARLIDGGVAADGRPYFAMEYVEGEPILAYADAAALGVEERLRLFLAVCEAVAYAHRRLIVHRDLKPSNILVTAEGEPKLLDFGIAKLLDVAEDGEGLTRTGHYLMTPEYAAPEQLTDSPISTATDVYTLGVLLFELLSGHRPYVFADRSPASVARVVCEQAPARPSTVVGRAEERRGVRGETRTVGPEEVALRRGTSTERLRRRLAGDLDVVCLKALRKEPERRYGSVEALAADVRRHLRGLPVSARPDTVGYRARKFARRHRVAVGAALVVVAALAVGLGAALWQAGRAEAAAAAARAEAVRAETEAATAEQISEFLVGLFGASAPAESRGDSVLVRDVLERGVASLADLDDQPAVRARMQAVLGHVYYEIGRLDRADSLLRAVLASGGLADPDEAADARLVLSSVQMARGDFDASVASARTVFDEARARYEGDHALVAASLTQVGYAYVSQGRFDEAEPYLTEAVAMQARLHPEPYLDHAEALDNLGVLYYQQRDYARALDLFRRALGIQRELHGGRPHPSLAISLDNVGAALLALDSLEQAVPYFEESVAMQARLHTEPHLDHAISLNNYGVLLLRAGRGAEAEQALQESLAIKRDLFGPDHPSVGITTGWLGQVALERGDTATAEARYRRAYAIAAASYEPGHGTRIGAAHALAELLAESGRRGEAERLYLSTYRETLAALGPDHALTHQATAPLPGFYAAWGRPDEAARYRLGP